MKKLGRRTVGYLVWLALEGAIRDRESYIDAWSGTPNSRHVKMALADIRAFRALQIKLFGTNLSEGEAMASKMKSVDLLQLLAERVDVGHFLTTGEKAKRQ